MRKVILSEWLALDGYVTDKAGQLNFFAHLVRQTFAEPGQLAFLKAIDTIIFGRHSYEQFAQVWPGRPNEGEFLAERMNTTKKIVFSKTLKDAPWGIWPKAEIDSGNAVAKIRQLKEAPGKDIVLFASISLAHALMKESLIDGYHLFICPVLTSGGRRLFTEEIAPSSLKLIRSTQYNTGVVCLDYQTVSNS